MGPQICFSFHLYRKKNALDSHASTVVGAVLGQRTVDTRVHAESCEPNISSLKQTKGHHCEGIGLYEGVGVEDVEEGERHQLEATGSSPSCLPAPLSFTYICTYTPGPTT